MREGARAMIISPEARAALEQLAKETLDYRKGVQGQINALNARITELNLSISRLQAVVDRLEKQQ